ncbi:MAG: hypothetical protein OXF68_11515 [Gammaproteobacteria bacterium]|nr:hypothetical protein [Gammaproteobacteria bacterium]
MPDISRGTVFWREAQNQAVNTSGTGHHWLVLLDPVDEDGAERVLWVPLSSFKSWLDPSKTYVFNLGKSNKYIDARKDSCPMLKYAEVTTVDKIAAEQPKRRHEIKEEHVAGICNLLPDSREAPKGVRDFYRKHRP